MPAGGTEIRQAKVGDAFSVGCLLKQQYVEHRIEAAMEELVPAVEHLILSPDKGRIFVSMEGSKMVGTAVMTFTWSIEHRGRIAWLDELYVVPDHRQRMVGTKLLRAVIAMAEDQGSRAIELEVDHQHARAEALYSREGFERVTRNRFVLRRY